MWKSPKPDGGIRKLGIPTVTDRIIQQAMLQQLMLIYEPLFSDDSFWLSPGTRGKRCHFQDKRVHRAGLYKGSRPGPVKVLRYAEPHNPAEPVEKAGKRRKGHTDGKAIPEKWSDGKRCCNRDKGKAPPQGGNLSPLLANVYLNEFDWEYHRRGVPCIRYADDIVLLAKSERAAERLLESSTKYLEETLKLRVNREKSRTVSVFAIRNF